MRGAFLSAIGLVSVLKRAGQDACTSYETRALSGAFAARRASGLGFRQVRKTIFFAIARHPKFEIWVRHFRRSTNRATMQRLRFGFAGLHFKTTAAGRYFTAVAGIVDDGGAEKDQIIRDCANSGSAKLHRADGDLHKQNRSRKPGDPFHL